MAPVSRRRALATRCGSEGERLQEIAVHVSVSSRLVTRRTEKRPEDQGALDELANSVRQRKTILFAGAGLSMGVGLPSWSQLVDRLAADAGLDEHQKERSTYQTLAEYYRVKHGDFRSLIDWMKHTWTVSREQVVRSDIHRLVVEFDFPLIYTTNYDTNIEMAFEAFGRPYTKICSARDVARAPSGVAQIVKFHGDFEDADSIVIGESDYFGRLTFDAPLDIKLRADALGHSLLFIGYSMSDVNIRYLLHRLRQTWDDARQQNSRPPSFLFDARPSPVEAAVLGQWGVRVLSMDDADPGAAVLKFLRQLKQAVDSG